MLATALAAEKISFRPIVGEDEGFLCQLYANTRQEELAVVDWSAERKTAFLTMQFNAQHSYYQEHYPGAAFQLILRRGQPIGRLYLDHWPDELRLMDIALVPAQRKQGIGSRILEALLAEGRRLGLPVRIHVECFNPALRLYQRLGFQVIEDKGVYLFMEKQPHVG
jgi:GNAT superfamily N-acetyltransferase